MTAKEVKDVINIMNDAKNVDFLRINFINYEKHSQVGISVNEIIDILNYQQAEIERLKKVNDSFTDIVKMYSEIRIEVIKEFIDVLDKNADNWRELTMEQIISLKEEFVGDDK